MTTYELIKSEDNNKGYGIKATKIQVFEDISSDYNAVKNLADTCNRCDVELEFFYDVLENYLTDYTF